MNSNMNRSGSSLIDVVVTIAIIGLLFSAIYAVYFALIDSINNIESRSAAAEVLAGQLEIIRNLPYDNVGTVSGIPAGVVPQNQTSTVGNFLFNVKTTVRNIDDPADGTIGGVPNDTAPADYKQVTLEISCLTCVKFAPFQFTTTVAPKNLENTAVTGSLFINVFDANGVGVSGVSVHLVNASVTPAIDLTDTTNSSGSLQLVGVATSSQSYQISVSKIGYSSEKTYKIGAIGNPNPVKPHATVASQAVTSISFSIDRLSSLPINTQNNICTAVGNQTISLAGQKIIGTDPDVLKYSTSTTTDASGVTTITGVEWDTYALTLSGSTYDITGTIPTFPVTVNPSTTRSAAFILDVPARPSALISVFDDVTDVDIFGASVTLSKTGYSQTSITGHSFVGDTTWVSGGYVSQSGGIEAENTPGSLTIASVSGTYPTSTVNYLISKTIDFGSSASSSLYSFLWTGNQPSNTAVQFQIAVNNDNATWNFIGPTGDSSYYTATSTVLSGFDGNRYARYKVFLTTNDQNVTPQVDSVRFEFSGVCTAPSAAFFSTLPTGTYDITVLASGYQTVSTTMTVSSNSWQQIFIPLSQ